MLFHGFRPAAKRDLTLVVFDITNICSAVFTKAITKILQSQPF